MKLIIHCPCFPEKGWVFPEKLAVKLPREVLKLEIDYRDSVQYRKPFNRYFAFLLLASRDGEASF